MKKEINILHSGNVYFFSRPKVEKEGTQNFFFVLHPIQQNKYQLLIVGKKKFPDIERGSYFCFVETVKKNKQDLLASLREKHYSTKTRGERSLSVSHCLGEGKYLLVEHNKHTHFIYQLAKPIKIKSIQEEFRLRKEDDHLISVKNPCLDDTSNIGLDKKKKVNYPEHLQKKFANYRFIPLNPVDFLDYEGTELLLIAKSKKNLSSRETELQNCLEDIPMDSIIKEFAKILPPEALTPIKE